MEKVYRHKVTKPLLSQTSGHVKAEHLYLPETSTESNLDLEDGPLYKLKWKRKTAQIGSDALILVLEFLQILALMQSMSLKWVWPMTWLHYTNFLLIFNVDVWDFVKVSSGVYKGVQDYDIPSSLLPFSFNYLVVGWVIFIFIVLTSFAVVYGILRYRRRPYLLVHTARMERALMIICQIFALPLGTFIFKMFHCTGTGQVDVLNDLTCFRGSHWAYLFFAMLTVVVLFIGLSGWMIYRTRHEVLASTSQHHERYLQLKEMEYISGLDVIWLVKGFHIFSSFRLNGVHYRAAVHISKLLLLIAYASLHQYILAQAITIVVILILVWFLFVIIRPFRILAFNIVFIMCYLCLIGDALFGASIASVPPSDVSSPWLVEPYATLVIAVVNVMMVIVIFMFLMYLIAAHFCCGGRSLKNPLWPMMNTHSADSLSSETNKFMNALLRGRAVLEKCRSVHPMFAPVHELSHQIQVINAYLREAELLADTLHDTLWDLLDEMILLHKKLEPKSLFGENVKDSIRGTTAELMKMMPMFSRRMAQRDYDFILVSPTKRRLLLKMFVMGVFLNGRAEKVAKQQITGPELEIIWPESSSNPVVEDKQEYSEDLYPEPLCGPDQEELSQSLNLPFNLMDLDEDEKSLSSIITGVPDLLPVPATGSRSGSSKSRDSRAEPPGFVNPAFLSDETEVSQTKQTGITLEDFEQGESTTDNTKSQQKVTQIKVEARREDQSTTSERSKDGGLRKKNRDTSVKRRKPSDTGMLRKLQTASAAQDSELDLPDPNRIDLDSSDLSKPTTGRSLPSSDHVTSEKDRSSEVPGTEDGGTDKNIIKKHKTLKKKKSQKK